MLQFVPIASSPATGHLIVPNILAVSSEKVSLIPRGKHRTHWISPVQVLGSHSY